MHSPFTISTKHLLFSVVLSLLFFNLSFSQEFEKDFKELYKNWNEKLATKLGEDHTHFDSLQKKRINSNVYDILGLINQSVSANSKVAGKASFAFNGNTSEGNQGFSNFRPVENDLFKVQVAASIKRGNYPVEVDFSASFQGVIQNGTFQEDVSDIDISMDIHPLTPRSYQKSYGLWFENYSFLKRFKNNFIGIDQRYEIGTGVVFNHYSKNSLTQKGDEEREKIYKYDFDKNEREKLIYYKSILEEDLQKMADSLERSLNDSINKPSVENRFTQERLLRNLNRLKRNDTIRISFRKLKQFYNHQRVKLPENITQTKAFEKFKKNYTKGNFEERMKKSLDFLDSKDAKGKYRHPGFQLKDKDYRTMKTGLRFSDASIIKKYSRIRLGMLFGINYELENQRLVNDYFIPDSLAVRSVSIDEFDSTNRLRFVVRPTFKWKPGDKYEFRLYPYFKYPLHDFLLTEEFIENGERRSIKRLDYFIDLYSDFAIEVDELINVKFFFRYVYDNTPKFKLDFEELGSIRGRNRFKNFGLALEFKF
jgi:hypothetical protein